MLTCTRLIPRFCPNAHHHGSLPQQLGVVWDLLLNTDPEGPTLIFHAACPHDWSVHDELLSVCACSTLKPKKSNSPSGTVQIRVLSSFTVSFSLPMIARRWCSAASALPLRHKITRSSAWVTRRVRGLRSRPGCFHPSTNRRM